MIKPFIGVNSDDDDIGMPLSGLHKLNVSWMKGVKGARQYSNALREYSIVGSTFRNDHTLTPSCTGVEMEQLEHW